MEVKKLKIVNRGNLDKIIYPGKISMGRCIYFSGELERDYDFDRVIIYHLEEFPEYMKRTLMWSSKNIKKIIGNRVVISGKRRWNRELYIKGEVEVDAFGIDKPCIGFFWIERKVKLFTSNREVTMWEQHGLICYQDDYKTIGYAKRKMKSKSVRVFS